MFSLGKWKKDRGKRCRDLHSFNKPSIVCTYVPLLPPLQQSVHGLSVRTSLIAPPLLIIYYSTHKQASKRGEREENHARHLQARSPALASPRSITLYQHSLHHVQVRSRPRRHCRIGLGLRTVSQVSGINNPFSTIVGGGGGCWGGNGGGSIYGEGLARRPRRPPPPPTHLQVPMVPARSSRPPVRPCASKQISTTLSVL